MVGSGDGDRGRKSAYRPLQAAVCDGATDIGLNPAAPEQTTAPGRLTNCPDCDAALTVLRIIPGRAGAEYWTMRCTHCGGIHLDIARATEVTQDPGDLRA
jgi:hypothetical protein